MSIKQGNTERNAIRLSYWSSFLSFSGRLCCLLLHLALFFVACVGVRVFVVVAAVVVVVVGYYLVLVHLVPFLVPFLVPAHQ